MFYIISIFEHSLKLELVLLELQDHQIPKESIVAKSVKKISQEEKYLDPYNTDGFNLFIVAALAMIFMLLGTIYGFVLYLGPIICGLIGLITGITIGLIIDYSYKKGKFKKPVRNNIADVIVLIKCKNEEVGMVEEILRKHHALGMIKL